MYGKGRNYFFHFSIFFTTFDIFKAYFYRKIVILINNYKWKAGDIDQNAKEAWDLVT